MNKMINNVICPICGKCCSYFDEFVIDKSSPKIKQYFHKICFDELIRKKVDVNEQKASEEKK